MTEHSNATQRFAEVYAGPVALNTYLKTMLAVAVAIIAGLVILNFQTAEYAANVKPLVIRIDDIGRAQAVDYEVASTYKPQAREIRYFLSRFVTLHFSRMRATLRRDFPESLYFLDDVLAQQLMSNMPPPQAVEKFYAETNAEEIEITVKNVSVLELDTPPYRASVDFERAYYTVGTRQKQKTERAVAQVTFTVKDTVPAAFIQVNPLGVVISRLQIDQAFE